LEDRIVAAVAAVSNGVIPIGIGDIASTAAAAAGNSVGVIMNHSCRLLNLVFKSLYFLLKLLILLTQSFKLIGELT
jgi:hypothetical protein